MQKWKSLNTLQCLRIFHNFAFRGISLERKVYEKYLKFHSFRKWCLVTRIEFFLYKKILLFTCKLQNVINKKKETWLLFGFNHGDLIKRYINFNKLHLIFHLNYEEHKSCMMMMMMMTYILSTNTTHTHILFLFQQI